MNYIQRKDSKRLGKLREQYLLYVYQHHIYSALLSVYPPKEYKKFQALEYVSTHPQCLEEYLNSRKWEEKDRQIISEWKREQFGEYRRVGTYPDHFEMYQVASKRLYAVCILDDATAKQMEFIRPEVVLKGSILPYRNKLVFDEISATDRTLSYNLEQEEAFYEQILHIRNEEGVYVNETEVKKYPFPDRSVDADMEAVIYDFISPVMANDYNALLMSAKYGWNLALREDEAIIKETQKLDEDLQQYVYFFKKRKDKYFADFTKEIDCLQMVVKGADECGFEVMMADAS